MLSKVTVATVTSLSSAGPQPPSRSPPHPRDRTLAIATVALLLAGVFDVGRALYCRYRLSYAVTQSASLLAGRPFAAANDDANALSAAAADLVRRISGLRDLPRSAVRVSSAATTGDAGDPSRMTLTVRYTLPILSPHVRALFRNGVVSLQAVAVRATRAPVPSAVAMCSAV